MANTTAATCLSLSQVSNWLGEMWTVLRASLLSDGWNWSRRTMRREDGQQLTVAQLAGYKLLIIDELGYVPLSQTGDELLSEVFTQRYERGSTVVTSNLPFDEWTSVFGSERPPLHSLDRLTQQLHMLQINGDSYRLNQSKRRSHCARRRLGGAGSLPNR